MHPHSDHQIDPQPPPPPTPPSLPSPSGTGFPILAISIVGILATAILLLSYYAFVIKCCFGWRRSDVLRHLSRSRRRWGSTDARAFPHLYLSRVSDRGLDESTIRSILTLRFRRGEQHSSCHECAVCLNEFQDEERIRILPSCLHVFHIDCIDTWLQSHASCPLCRARIASTRLLPLVQPSLDQGGSVVIDVRDGGSDQTSRTTEAGNNTASSVTTGSPVAKGKKLPKVSSLGDECIDTREKNERFAVQPMRRSFSMDSCSDGQLYMAVQEILRQNPHFRSGEGSSTGSGRTRRSFFSFSGHSRTSTNIAGRALEEEEEEKKKKKRGERRQRRRRRRRRGEG